MFELITKAPSEAWIGLLGVFLGAVLSLFGSWLTSKSNIRQLQIQLEHKELSQTKEIKRERFEELYVLLGHWLNSIFGNYMYLTLVMKGQMDYNDYLDRITEKAEKHKLDFNRIEMIINIYGQELKEAYQDVLTARTNRNNIEAEHKKTYKDGGLEANHFLEPFTKAQVLLEERTETLRKQVAEAASNV